MRLTLRTLLAYLDDVLDPDDKETLGKKIESSEFAEDLIHRTKDTMRRLRLSAPQVVGTGMGLDPNSVAEYLDNVMPPEKVGDFERICLESDMHLAEVASCHHVLTMVLGQPADIDPAAKQRMYTLPAEAAERKQVRVEPAHVSVAGQPIGVPVSVGAALAAHSAAPAREVEIPEYLRASGWARFRGPLLAAAAVVLIAATLYFSGTLQRWFGSGAETVALATALPAETNVAPEVPSAPLPAAPAVTPGALEVGGEGGIGVGDDAAHAATQIGVGDDPARNAVVAEGAAGARYPETAATPAETLPATVISPETQPTIAAPESMPAPVATIPWVEIPAPAATTVPETANMPVDTSEPPATVDVDPDGTVRVVEVPPATVGAASIAEPPAAVEPPAVVELGTYRGGKTVLLRYDDTVGTWLRAAPRSAVVKGERMLALPEFRPLVTLASGVHLELAGGTLVAVNTAGDTAAIAPTTIEVVYGRIVLINTSGEERPVHLVLGATSAEARMAQNATLAVELDRKYVPGNDPRTMPAPVIARLYVPDGGVVWRDANGITTVDTASEWTISDGVPTALVASAAPPSWIDADAAAQTSEQRYGAPAIEGGLAANRPADVQLLELFQGTKQREVKSLIARSGLHVGLYAPFIEALRDSAQRPNWDAHIQSLRSAMALGPESAAKIRKALVEQRGEAAAADLYEMLCGYNADQIGRTPEQVKTGAIARLIEWLDQDSLDYRVLAKHDLWEITGKQLMPNPAGRLSDRKTSLKRWRSQLEAGELMPAAEE